MSASSASTCHPSDTASLWKTFSSARSEGEYFHYWLALQSLAIAGVIRSLVVVDRGNNQLEPASGWPEGDTEFGHLAEIVERVADEQCGLLVELDQKNYYGVAYPLIIDDELHGVVALEVVAASEEELQKSMEQLQWGIGWLELLIRRQQVENNKEILKRLKSSVDLLAVTLNKEDFNSAATAFVTELAMISGCERVSLGFLVKKRSKLQAVSYSADIDQKMNLTRALEDAMDEAILQRREIIYPSSDDQILINRAHEGLSRKQSMVSIATFPFYCNERYYGALTCERAADQPFNEKDIEFFRAVTSLAGPALEGKYIHDRPLFVKIRDAGKNQLQKVVGAGHLARKSVLLLLALVTLFCCFATGEYRLSVYIVLEGAVRRSVVTPFDGFLDDASMRAGDFVEQGELLCLLDDRDLRLVNFAKHSEFRQLQRQRQSALARHDRAQAKIIRAQLQQAQAEIDLVEAKLTRTRLVAPFSGLVVSGDLSQRLGGAVKQGEVLFEITPLEKYRVILKVDERRIGDVRTGQKGTLVLASQPQKKFAFTVTKITPLATAEEGRNCFRVEAGLDTIEESLRPGMEGIGKINIDRRKLFSIWTRDMVDWLQLKLWIWFA